MKWYKVPVLVFLSLIQPVIWLGLFGKAMNFGALFPSKFMLSWLQAFVSVNPITYGTDVGRQLLLGSPGYASLAFDFLYLSLFAVIFGSVGIVMSWKLLTK
jgi:ABC-type polysaccharide/polyol phosphate export permease